MEEKKGVQRELMLIDGEWKESSDGRFIPVENPAKKGTVIGEVPSATEADVHMAVNAAAKAFETWKKVPARERGKIMLKIADAMEAQCEELTRLLALETGNAIRTQSRPEAVNTVDVFRLYGGFGSELKGETIPLGEQVLCYTRREPLGVVAGIIPWNSPLILGAIKIAMALTAGNTMVLKPATDAPLTVLLMAKICAAHLPKGVLNVITGLGNECGAALARHPMVNKLSLTGSTDSGKNVMLAAADRIVPVTLELGGKSPQVVFPDAFDDQTVQSVINGVRFTRQGQSCTAGSRLFLHASIFDAFISKLVEKVSALKIGDPLDEATDIGTVINRKQFDMVSSYIQNGLGQSGAKLAMGGLPPTEGPLTEGYFLVPTVFTNIKNEWRIAREEIFGPVLVAIPWETEEEVVRMANDSHYGLAGYVYSHDIAKALRTAHGIESGYVQINQGFGVANATPYGGFKQSGIGREFSLEGMLDSYTQRKTVTVNLMY
ncbi:MAG: putative aldehyde dehydrogenase AldA [Syntrophorhabdus sp. PtaU1.Bin058]|nr:MAG: putative aldehyde dehydrogenase AldA [Syntrophorhabdus sp. PtaU1.Bin058]